MDEKTKKQMAKMVDAVQPFCDEPITAAMTCSHAGAMSSQLIGGILSGTAFKGKPTTLPNPVMIAVGADTVYAFKYAPRGFKFKIKKEVARWRKESLRVDVEKGKMAVNFTLTTPSGESHQLEVYTVMGGAELVDVFLDALTG